MFSAKNFVVVIPTYKRYEELKKKTLALLKRIHLDVKNRVYIFVANEEEKEKYLESLKGEDYYKIVVGEKGVKNIRNFICNYFDENINIFFMDDDLTDVIGGYKDNDIELSSLTQIIQNGFNECKKKGLNLFGFYPVNNKYFMKNNITYDLRFINGGCYGLVNKKLMLNTDDYTDEKEDYERTLQYYIRDGGVIRFNFISFKTKILINNSKGGMGDRRNLETIKKGAEFIKNTYPDLCKLFVRKDGRFEIKLNYRDKLYKKIFLKPDIKIFNIENLDVYDNLLKELENITLPKIERYRKNCFDLSRGTLLGHKGRTIHLGYARRRGLGNGLLTFTNRYMKLYKLAIEYGLKNLPKDFIFTTLTINHNLRCLPHKDGANAGISCLTTLGDYKGGGLFIEGKLYPTKNKILMFDGSKYLHETEKFEGNRYSIIYYKQKIKNIPDEYLHKVI